MKKLLPLLALFLPACASMSTMESKNMADVPTKTFAAPKAEVVKATELTIGKLGLGITETRVSEPTTEIFFTKAISAFSWGEVGRIDVTGLTTTGTSGSSIVAITSAKR